MVMLSRDPGDTTTTAFDLGNLSEANNYTNFLDDSDLVDLYQFSLDKKVKFRSCLKLIAWMDFLSIYL